MDRVDTHPARLAVLLSGRGSNFEAIHEAIGDRRLHATIVSVITNNPDAPAIARAQQFGYPAHVVDHRAFASREAHERELARILDGAVPDLIVLAGYMRLLSASFIERYRNRTLNIHPSLLPAFPGMNAQAQALAYGVRVAGCTVHLVDEHLDAGPIVVQRPVEVHDDDTVESLSARILEQEHEAYVDALISLTTRTWRLEGRRVIFD